MFWFPPLFFIPMSQYLIQHIKQSNNLKKFHNEIYIELDSYFKYSGMVEYKNKIRKAKVFHPLKEKVIIKNDMTKYKLNKN